MNDTRPCYFCHEQCRRHLDVVTLYPCFGHTGITVCNYYDPDYDTIMFVEMRLDGGHYIAVANFMNNFFGIRSNGKWIFNLDFIPPNINPENISDKISKWILWT